MKFFLSVATLLAVSLSSQAQQTNSLGCIDPDTRLLTDEVRQHYAQQGYAVVRNAMLNMTSQQPFSAVLDMSANETYQVAFVANKNASQMDTRVIGPNKKQLLYQNVRVKKEGKRVITFPFRTDRTDAFLFIMQQNVRNEATCGGFLVFRDTLKNRTKPVVSF
jgi:carbamoylphosphate synthase small subunit